MLLEQARVLLQDVVLYEHIAFKFTLVMILPTVRRLLKSLLSDLAHHRLGVLGRRCRVSHAGIVDPQEAVLAVVADDRVCAGLSLVNLDVLLVVAHAVLRLAVLRLVTLRRAVIRLRVVVHDLLNMLCVDLMGMLAVRRLPTHACSASLLLLALRAMIVLSGGFRASREGGIRRLGAAGHGGLVIEHRLKMEVEWLLLL